jgi:hypothetical protein
MKGIAASLPDLSGVFSAFTRLPRRFTPRNDPFLLRASRHCERSEAIPFLL